MLPLWRTRRGACSSAASGALVATAEGTHRVAAFDVDVFDTTGCGDAFSAGFLTAVLHGRTPVEAATLGNATAAQVVQGLGTDHGSFDLASVEAFAASTPIRD